MVTSNSNTRTDTQKLGRTREAKARPTIKLFNNFHATSVTVRLRPQTHGQSEAAWPYEFTMTDRIINALCPHGGLEDDGSGCGCGLVVGPQEIAGYNAPGGRLRYVRRN
jgi:hypothetical protein